MKRKITGACALMLTAVLLSVLAPLPAGAEESLPVGSSESEEDQAPDYSGVDAAVKELRADPTVTGQQVQNELNRIALSRKKKA